MGRKVLGGLLVCAAMLVAMPGAGAGVPVVSSHRAVYDFYLGGIWAGEMAVEAAFNKRPDGDGTYSARVKAQTAGIVGFFFTAGVVGEAVGMIDVDGLSPLRFVADAYELTHRQQVEMSYGNGALEIRAEPAYRVRPWSMSPEGMEGIADPLSASYEAFAPATADAICNQTAEMFDGSRRWAIAIGPPLRVGDRTRCDAVYVRIAGFKPKLMGAEARRPFALFYEQRSDGLFHAVRAVGQTSFGLAVLLLRE
ncbi:MAG TPA: DUF3108 domain-containing protein [Thermohalobaculum sp.]|nr:DUF3108 domain-containing protein [Thermohalobaculum sp.]